MQNKNELANDGFLTVAAAVNFSALGRSTLYGLMETGVLPYAKIGTARRIPKRALVEFMANKTISREAGN